MHVFGLLFLTLAVACRAQVPFFGPCDSSIKPMQNFNSTKYLGKWYEQEKYFAIFEYEGKCVSATYSNAGAGVIGVSNRQYTNSTGIIPIIIEGTAKAAADAAPLEARFEVVFPSLPLQIPAPYWVLDTDYSSYAVVYSCNNFGIFHTKFVWILSRDSNIPAEVIIAAHAVLEKNKISLDFLTKTNRVNCPWEI